MSKPLRPGDVLLERASPAQTGAAAVRPTKPPKREVAKDPDFVPTLIGRQTMKSLRQLQKADKPPLNLKYLSEACQQLGLEQAGGEAVRERAHLLAQSAKEHRSKLPS